MSDYTPITGELRGVMFITESEQGTPMVKLGWFRFKQLCDAIDTIHAQLERENAALKAKLDLVLGEQEEHRHSISEVTVTITPTLDWSAVALELHSLACHLAGDAE